MALEKITGRHHGTFVAIMGGAKVADKIKAISALLPKASRILIGGAMAYPLLKAKGFKVGKSLCSENDFQLATSLLQMDKNQKLVLPLDHMASEEIGAKATVTTDQNIPDHLMGLDIGPKTIEHYQSLLAQAKTIFWNGPMGCFENPLYAQGTNEMAKALAESTAYTVVGGGDSARAVGQSGLASKMGHISTGGGAALEFIEQGELPGINALKFGLEF